MSKVLAWIRKSKGADDDIGLESQRERVSKLAEELAAEVDTLDLGVQTGFSTLSRNREAPTTWLDEHPEVQQAVSDLRAGKYDYLVALDDRRICRDDYIAVIEHAATAGDCEFRYVRDVADDDLAYDIHRRVERETKEEEIEKAKQALERRKERGYDHGRPRFGMTYDENSHYQIPGEEFDTVMKILKLRREGSSYPKISERVDVPVSTAKRVVDRREWYIERTDLVGGEG